MATTTVALLTNGTSGTPLPLFASSKMVRSFTIQNNHASAVVYVGTSTLSVSGGLYIAKIQPGGMYVHEDMNSYNTLDLGSYYWDSSVSGSTAQMSYTQN